jgi:hypothetical protein
MVKEVHNLKVVFVVVYLGYKRHVFNALHNVSCILTKLLHIFVKIVSINHYVDFVYRKVVIKCIRLKMWKRLVRLLEGC